MELFDLREPVSAWSHATWLLMSLPATWYLWRRSVGDRPKRLSLLVFGLSLAFCAAASTLYHGARLSAKWIAEFDRIDHIGIFMLIAGSYTPMAWSLLRGRWRWGTLSLAWLLTLAGTTMLLAFGVLSSFWCTALYLGMGWGALACYFELARRLTHRAIFPLLLGGIFYSVGAVLNLAGWPVLRRGVVGPHEIFHLFVIAGSLSHFWFMVRVVVPATPARQATPGPALGAGHCLPIPLRVSPRSE